MNFQFFTSRISSDSTKRFFGYDFRDGENITHEGQGEYSGSWHFGFEVSGVYTWPR